MLDQMKALKSIRLSFGVQLLNRETLNKLVDVYNICK